MLKMPRTKLIAHMTELARSKTPKKADASRRNGLLGGRPKKDLCKPIQKNTNQ